jgi:hypothetical protein
MTRRTVSWTKEMIKRLTVLWGENHSISTISKTMTKEFGVFISRNAVAGKALRSGLPRRDNPIEIAKKTSDNRQQSKPLPRIKSKKLPSPPPWMVKRDPAVAPTADSSDEPLAKESTSALREIKPVPDLEPRYAMFGKQCQFIEGDPLEPGSPFTCTEPRIEGRPYCEGHSRRCFQKVLSKDDTEDKRFVIKQRKWRDLEVA